MQHWCGFSISHSHQGAAPISHMQQIELPVCLILNNHNMGSARHGVNSILSIPIPIPPNSIWSIPHQIYQFQFKIDQFQFNSVYIFLYDLCKIFLIHLLFYYLAIYWYVYIIIHIAIYSIYMNTYIQTNNMFMMLWCVFICDCYTGPS